MQPQCPFASPKFDTHSSENGARTLHRAADGALCSDPPAQEFCQEKPRVKHRTPRTLTLMRTAVGGGSEQASTLCPLLMGKVGVGTTGCFQEVDSRVCSTGAASFQNLLLLNRPHQCHLPRKRLAQSFYPPAQADPMTPRSGALGALWVWQSIDINTCLRAMPKDPFPGKEQGPPQNTEGKAWPRWKARCGFGGLNTGHSPTPATRIHMQTGRRQPEPSC